MIYLMYVTIRDRLTSLIAYCGGVLALLWLYIGLFPSIQNQAASFNKLMEQFPEALRKGLNMDTFDYSNLGSYIASEMFSFMWPILTIVIALSFAGGCIAGEIEKGTIELLLAQPVSRTKLFFSRYLSAVVFLALFSLVSVASIIPFAKLYHITSYVPAHVWHLLPFAFLFAVSILSVAFLFSAIFSEKGKVYFASAGVLIAMYVANIISGLKDSLGNLKYISFFHYFNAGDVLLNGTNSIASYWAFGVVTITCTLAALIVFNRRDIAV